VDREKDIRRRYKLLRGELSERTRRLFAAAEAKSIGYGGVSLVSRATGLGRPTIRRGLRELGARGALPQGRVRRQGAGRKTATERDETLLADLERLVEPVSRGDPESALRWTAKSLRRLAEELRVQGHSTNRQTVADLLHGLGYSLQANTKTREGGRHPDRNAQFEHIHRRVQAQLAAQAPAISVDTKKKELVGNFKNGGLEWRPKGKPEEVRVHDFIDAALGKAIPYGVYDIGRNVGWVSVGVDHDTGAFAVATIRRWWRELGSAAYPRARSICVFADGGGSNGSRVRLWKWELQKLADETGLVISVSHLPPGTSKWNKIEHRLFSFISKNWRGKPLLTCATIVSLIAATTTTKGLKVHACLDAAEYPAKIRITDQQMTQIRLVRDTFHGEWNYSILPRGRADGSVTL
jgi:transposase